MRGSRVTRGDTGQERAHSVEQHRNTLSSGQSLVKMDTVADGLASLSFQQGRGDEEEEEEEESKKERGGKEEEIRKGRRGGKEERR